MSAFFSRFNPVPVFPTFTGPYRVGSLDVEIPVEELPSPAPAPDPTIPSVSFRIFYPCEVPIKPAKPVYWLPEPQRAYVGAYIRFLGASRRLSSIIQYFPLFSLFCNVTIPVSRDAHLLSPPTESKRWPLMLFSHGLAGSKNAYSQLAGSMASHGIVVIAPDHRDGSAPVSFARNADGSICEFAGYKSIPHRPGPDVEDARNEQLKVRLWELGLVHEALLKIDRHEPLSNMVPPDQGKNSQPGTLAMFGASLDIHTPGRMVWSGHSFGAVTVLQFLKSVFYHRDVPGTAPSQSLYKPAENFSIENQVTSASPLILFDLWSLPLQTKATEWLWRKPLPCYTTSGHNASNLLAVLSEAFWKWRANLSLFEMAVFPEYTLGKERAAQRPAPYVFYALTSTHMGQSDFGVLSPWMAQKVFKSDDPVRALRLNIRAALEMLRQNGFDIADTSMADMEEGPNAHVGLGPRHGRSSKGQDRKILALDGSIKGWIALKARDDLGETGFAVNTDTSITAAPSEAVVEGETLKDRPVNAAAHQVTSMM